MFLITGGGSGIGRELALALANLGKEVLIVGRRAEPLIETAAQSPLIHYVQADVSSQEGRNHLIQYLDTRTSIEGLVHNAGIIEPIAPIHTIKEEEWAKILATNLNTPLFLTQALLSRLKQGRVLHVGSGAAYFPVQGWAAYCVSKAALSMLTRCWHLEQPEIAFASVMPGIIDTPMQAVIRASNAMDKTKHDFFLGLKNEDKLVSAQTVALFLSWLLLDVPVNQFVAREWDIYDKAHHSYWLVPPYQLPHWESE